MHFDLGIEVHRDAKRMFNEKDDVVIVPTRYNHFDQLIGGGLARPSLLVVAGQSGFGKSVTMSNFAINFASIGYNVMYISLEMHERRCFDRFAAMMTDIPIREVRRRNEEASEILERRFDISDGMIWVKRFPMTGTTISDIRAYFREVMIHDGKKPDVLIVDYLDKLYPMTKGFNSIENIHLKDRYASEELYDFLVENNLIGITASQLKKGAEDKEEFTQGTMSGGTEKVNVADLIGTIRRNFENNSMLMTLIKARDGGHEGVVPFHWDNQTLRITDGPQEEFWDRNPQLDPRRESSGRFNKKIAQKQSSKNTGISNGQKAMAQANRQDATTAALRESTLEKVAAEGESVDA